VAILCAMKWISVATTRLAGTLSLIALVLVSISDFTFTEFWDENAMATSIVADVLVLVVGVAVVNEFLAARSRSRWQLVAEYGLVELARSCRRVWIGLAERIGVGSRSELTREELRDLLEDHDRSGQLDSRARGAHELGRSARRVGADRGFGELRRDAGPPRAP
jgi:hypothetical protein